MSETAMALGMRPRTPKSALQRSAFEFPVDVEPQHDLIAETVGFLVADLHRRAEAAGIELNWSRVRMETRQVGERVLLTASVPVQR